MIRLSRLHTAVVVLTGACLAIPATAQRPSPPLDSKYHLAPSVILWPVHQAGKSEQLKPASQKELVEDVVGQALRLVDEAADEHFHEGEYDHAINLSRIMVQGDPHDVQAYGSAWYLLWSTDRDDQAVQVIKQGIANNPDNYYMYDEMGSHYLMQAHQQVKHDLSTRQYADAIPFYEHAVKFACPYTTWHMLANCYEKTNQWQKAVDAWSTVSSKFPDDLLAPRRLKRARQQLGQSAPGSAK